MTNKEESLKFNQHYRPDKFADIIGQEENLKTLDNSIITNQIQDAIILYGVPGVGKTTAGRVYANKLICLDLDEHNEPCGKCDACIDFKNNPYTAGVIEIDGASNASVNEIRALKNGIKYTPKYKKNVVIIDEAQDVRGPGASALLKVLEEPPANTVFILITTEYMSILKAIRSRCSPYYFQPVTPKDIKSRLLTICLEQDIKISEQALDYISEGVDGCVRDALRVLQQASIASNKNIKEKHLKGLVNVEPEYIKSLLPFMVNNNTSEIISYINNNVPSVVGQDFDFIVKNIRKVLLNRSDLDYQIKSNLIKVANIFLKYKSELSLYPNHKIAMEFAFIEAGNYIEEYIEDKELLMDLFQNKDKDTTNNQGNMITIDKKELFLDMLYISNPKAKDLLKECEISLDGNGSILKFLLDTEEEKNELRKILSSKTPQKIKPIVDIEGFIVKRKDDNQGV